MRIRCFLRNRSDRSLSYNYHYPLGSALRDVLGTVDETLADRIHADHHFRPFNYSELTLHKPFDTSDGLSFDTAEFVLSSPDDALFNGFGNGLLNQDSIQVESVPLTPYEVTVIDPPSFEPPVTVRTKSPIYIGVNEDDGTRDLYPDDDGFVDRLNQNLCARYDAYHDESRPGEINDLTTRDYSGQRIRIKNCWWRCSHGQFTLDAPSELLKFAYETGLGQKNGLGFGAIEVGPC